MKHCPIMRIKKLKGSSIVLNAAGHNKRTIQAELGADSHIHSNLTRYNYSLTEPLEPSDISALADRLMHESGVVKLRKDAVRALEVVFSLPVKSEINHRNYFSQCLEWCREVLGGYVLSFDVHLDEVAPHAHALILPLIDNRMRGSQMMGNKSRITFLQSSYFENVAQRYGFSKPLKSLVGLEKQMAIESVLSHLSQDVAMESVLWPIIRNHISQSPETYCEHLEIAVRLKPKKERSFVSIMTSKGKGKSYETYPV